MAKKTPFPRPSHPARPGAVGTVATSSAWQNIIICAFLVAAVFAVFGQTAHFQFVNYDDDENVYANAVVSRGLTWWSVGWAFTHTQVFNWIPLTTLSHMLDCSFFGTNAGGPHLVNVTLHAASAVLLFLVLSQMTGRRWCSAFVAAVFAVHPLRAESVAWVSERKDVLSGFFFLLTLWAYVRNLRRPSWPGRLAVMLFFALGLLSKSMVVTLPLVLLLLDYWPLGRWRQPRQLLPLVVEKLPLFALAAAACAAAVAPGLMTGSQHVPLGERLGTGLVAGVIYLWQTVCPVGLAVGYPGGQPVWEIALAAVLLAAITAVVLAGWRTRPYLLVGWLWYLVMLLPVCGIVQIAQYVAHADRYTYLPGLGLLLGGTWAVAGWSAGWRRRRPLAGGVMVVLLGLLLFAGHRQTAFWRDSETLWKHALACTAGNNVAHNNLGNAFAAQGRLDEAIAQYRLALALKSDYAECHFNLGNLYNKQGRLEEAIGEYQQALAIEPHYVAARLNLGNALSTQGRDADALAQYRQAVAISPDGVEARYNLALELARQGRVDESIAQYRRAIELNPDYTAARNNLGAALLQQGDAEGALAQYRRVLDLDPANAVAHNNLGVALLSRAQVDDAVAQFRQALALQPDYPAATGNLGKALLKKGDLDAALACYGKITNLGPDPSARWQNLGQLLMQNKDWPGAVASYQQAVNLHPDSPPLCARLGLAFYQDGQARSAVDAWRRSLNLDPAQVEVQNNLAWVLATTPDDALRNADQALLLANQARLLSGGDHPILLRTLAAAYAGSARYSEALTTARRALQLALQQTNAPLAGLLTNDLARYQNSSPLREAGPGR